MKKILVINPFGIGDTVFTLYVVRALRQAYPDAFIGFLCNERTEDLVRLCPDINETYVFSRDLLRGLWKSSPWRFFKKFQAMIGMLREKKFDQSLDYSLNREYGFYAFLAGVKKQAGLNYKNRDIFFSKRIKFKGYADKHVVETQLDLLRLLNIPFDERNLRLNLRLPESAKSKTAPNKKIIGIAPGGGKTWGANASYKQWDAKRFAQVIGELVRDDKSEAWIFGSLDELGILEEVHRLTPGKSRIICEKHLVDTIAFMGRCSFFLANDGGLLHLADALGITAFGIYGPVDTAVYGLYSQKNRENVIYEDVPCRPCYRNFNFPPCPHNKQCLEKLEVSKVLSQIEKIA